MQLSGAQHTTPQKHMRAHKEQSTGFRAWASNAGPVPLITLSAEWWPRKLKEGGSASFGDPVPVVESRFLTVSSWVFIHKSDSALPLCHTGLVQARSSRSTSGIGSRQ